MAVRRRHVSVRSAIRLFAGRGFSRAACAVIVCAIWATGANGELPTRTSDDGVWTSTAPLTTPQYFSDAGLDIARYREATLHYALFEAVAASVPLESGKNLQRAADARTIRLPLPDGSFGRFAIVESPVMAPRLAANYPEIRTYRGWGIDDPYATLRCDLSPTGFHAQVLSPRGAVYIDPLEPGDSVTHISYFARDYGRSLINFECGTPDAEHEEPAANAMVRATGELRTYRLAIAATREYTQYHGGTVNAGMSAIVTAINRVTGIYENDLGIRLELVANNDLLVYTSEPDPYTNGNGSTMAIENQANIDAVIGDGNYDLGHVFATSGTSQVSGRTCVSGQKALAVTALSPPIGDRFYVDYVAHEMGHQFNASHTFNGVSGSCAGSQRIAGSAYEPGSGSTIMAYAGICGLDNLQLTSDPFFHHESIRQITNFITAGSGSNCGSITMTGNADPTVSAGFDYVIPIQTPFVLTATGGDIDGDSVTYSWEERDLGNAAAASAADDGTIPLFRAWDPKADPSRTFPRFSDLLDNNTVLGEQLPNSNRTLNFRVTARDNHSGGGGTAFDDMQLTVFTSAGPFEITAPNSGAEVWGTNGVVTWNVADTDIAPINVASVDILLSTNGGLTFPIALATATANDGSESVAFAVPPTLEARIMVRANGHVFFDVNDADFTIDSPALVIDLPNGAPSELSPGVPTSFAVEIIPLAESLAPGTALLNYRYDGGAYQTAALTPMGGTAYEARLPRAVCTDTPEFYVSAEGNLGAVIRNPADAPTNAFAATISQVTDTLFADDFETDLGWTVTASSGSVDGLWERGTPVNEGRGDPPADHDGSGQCYVTENTATYPASDVDLGSTTLTSPALDLPDGGTLSYAYWLNDEPAGLIGAEDGMVVEYATDVGGTNWQLIRAYDTAEAAWRTDSIEVGTETAGSATFRIRFVVTEVPPGDVVEAGLDAFAVVASVCPDVGSGDFDVDGDVDLQDFAALQTCWTEPSLTVPCEPGDLDGNNVLDAIDLDIFTIIQANPLP
jgi:hypothetical protein